MYLTSVLQGVVERSSLITMVTSACAFRDHSVRSKVLDIM